jgi:hypothetical protein
MQTRIANSSRPVEPTTTHRSTLSWILLICGVLSALLWVAGDIAASLSYPGYSYVDYSVSELSAIGAPTRSWLAPMGLVTVLLELAFAVGIWLAAPSQRGLRIAAILLFVHAAMNVAIGLVNLVTPFAAMHTREEIVASGGGTATDTLHLVYAAVTVVLILSTIGFAARAFGRGWRWYSIATIVAALAFGAWAATYAPAVAANQATPGLGLIERVNVYSFYLWEALLAVMLLRARATAAQSASGRTGPVPAH